MATNNYQLFFFLPLLLAACTKSPLPPSMDKADLHLSGQVQTVTITEYDAIRENGNFVPLDTLTFRTITFSPEGRIETIKHESGEEHYFYAPGSRTIKRYDIDGEPDHDEIAHYDAQGNMVSWGLYFPDGEVMTLTEFSYANNRCVEKRVFSGNREENLINRDYRYDDAGHVLAYTSCSPQGKVYYKWQCSYDAEGRPVCEQWIDENDSVMSTDRYTYNDRVLLDFHQVGEYSDTYSYRYDEQGNYIEKIATPSDNQERLVYTIETREITYFGE